MDGQASRQANRLCSLGQWTSTNLCSLTRKTSSCNRNQITPTASLRGFYMAIRIRLVRLLTVPYYFKHVLIQRCIVSQQVTSSTSGGLSWPWSRLNWGGGSLDSLFNATSKALIDSHTVVGDFVLISITFEGELSFHTVLLNLFSVELLFLNNTVLTRLKQNNILDFLLLQCTLAYLYCI